MAARLKPVVRAEWTNHVLVCGKCSKKLGGGFGSERDKPLAKMLRKYLGVGKGRKSRIGIVETKCLDLCPAGAVTVINAADPRHWHVVTPEADIAAVAKQIGLTD